MNLDSASPGHLYGQCLWDKWLQPRPAPRATWLWGHSVLRSASSRLAKPNIFPRIQHHQRHSLWPGIMIPPSEGGIWGHTRHLVLLLCLHLGFWEGKPVAETPGAGFGPSVWKWASFPISSFKDYVGSETEGNISSCSGDFWKWLLPILHQTLPTNPKVTQRHRNKVFTGEGSWG